MDSLPALYLLPLLPLLGFTILMILPRLFPGKTGGWLATGMVGAAFVVEIGRAHV